MTDRQSLEAKLYPWIDTAITDVAGADIALAHIARAEKRREEVRALTGEYIKKIVEWEKAQLEEADGIIQIYTEALEPWIRETVAKGGNKTVKLFNGKVQLRKNPDKLEVAEDVELPDSMVRIKREPDKAKIWEQIKATGEVPAGVTVIPGGEKINVTIEKWAADGLEEGTV